MRDRTPGEIDMSAEPGHAHAPGSGVKWTGEAMDGEERERERMEREGRKGSWGERVSTVQGKRRVEKER